MKHKLVVLKTLISLLFIIGTVITSWIVYQNLAYPWTYPFVIGYLVLVFLIVIYMLFTGFSNLRQMKWVEVKKTLKNFFALFLLFWTLNLLLSFLTKGRVNMLSDIFIPLGLAAGIAFAPKVRQ